ncbi:MAG: hypothetical protein M1835_001734 [Candelina submexicana]|nr:MAG: hypothetical protein M1835_001734 [Candelina submexicana]
MAGSSFASGRFQSHFVDLDYVDRNLQWNPYPPDREATQHFWWDTVPESLLQYRNEEPPLERAKRRAEARARLLSQYHKGRIILDAEAAGEYAADPNFWFARAAYYQVEYEKLEEEDYNRASREMTPEFIHPDLFGENELDRAKCSAENAARYLARFPTGKALLEAEPYVDSITNPEYWWSKEKLYGAQLKAELEKTALERAKHSADEIVRKLVTFPAGKALIEAEDHGDSATDPEYWSRKEEYYWDQYRRLKQEYWDRWKRIHLEGASTSPMSLNVSTPTTRVRQSSGISEGHTTMTTRSTARRRKGTDPLQLGANEKTPNSYDSSNRARDGRCKGRRKSKNKYRRENAHVVERKPPSPPPSSSAAQKSPNGYASPKSDESRTRGSTTQERYEGPAHKVTDVCLDGRQRKAHLLPHDPYVTPSSPDFSIVRSRQLRKPKGAARQKRRRNADSIYRGTRTILQSIEPISSRLRSSRYLRCKGMH